MLRDIIYIYIYNSICFLIYMHIFIYIYYILIYTYTYFIIYIYVVSYLRFVGWRKKVNLKVLETIGGYMSNEQKGV